ncbi:MAG: diphthine--ammonia ligase [Chitinophagaceae bacterium]|nr:MAG: diphthine--ammonia ligase [Chitinophagaceae bacterium]
MKRKKCCLFWSGGKDSALALEYLLRDESIEVQCLATTINSETNRVSMHGVRLELIEKQAELCGIKLEKMILPGEVDNAIYEQVFSDFSESLLTKGIEVVAFGDIFLQDLRDYREKLFEGSGMEIYFPLWNKPTGELLKEFIDKRFDALVICTNSQLLGKEFLGQHLNETFRQRIPENVDPCGENGEYHSLVLNAPYFSNALEIKKGRAVLKKYKNDPAYAFYFLEVKPAY